METKDFNHYFIDETPTPDVIDNKIEYPQFRWKQGRRDYNADIFLCEENKHVYFKCPCGCNEYRILPYYKTGEKVKGWGLIESRKLIETKSELDFHNGRSDTKKKAKIGDPTTVGIGFMQSFKHHDCGSHYRIMNNKVEWING